MAVNLSALSFNQNTAVALSNLILVNPQKDVGIQPQAQTFSDGAVAESDPAFLFNFNGEQTLTLDSDITDHYIEDNTAIQDQISLKPEMITTHGFIGELNDIVPDFLQPAKFIADKLTVVSGYTPALSATGLLVYAKAAQAYQVAQLVAAASVGAWDTITGGAGNKNQTKQAIAFQKFYGYWNNRTLFTVQTPWGVFKDAAIKTLRAVQDAETRMITDFEITFKLLKFAKTSTTTILQSSAQGRLRSQSASEINNGISAGSEVPTSLSGSISSVVGVA